MQRNPDWRCVTGQGWWVVGKRGCDFGRPLATTTEARSTMRGGPAAGAETRARLPLLLPGFVSCASNAACSVVYGGRYVHTYSIHMYNAERLSDLARAGTIAHDPIYARLWEMHLSPPAALLV